MMIAGTERRRQGCSLQDGKQWGYCSSRTATFPIPFPTAARFIVAVPKTTSTSATATGAEYLGTTSVNLYLHELRVGISQAAIEQWRNNPGLWAIPFTEFVAGGITMTRTGSQSSGTWYGDSGTISLTGYTASCATNESWVSNISGSAIAVGL